VFAQASADGGASLAQEQRRLAVAQVQRVGVRRVQHGTPVEVGARSGRGVVGAPRAPGRRLQAELGASAHGIRVGLVRRSARGPALVFWGHADCSRRAQASKGRMEVREGFLLNRIRKHE
jgi:hypothetical protein